MKSGAHGVALRLAKALARRTVVVFTLLILAVVTAGMGMWTHRAYAAKTKAEKEVRQQAATLSDVMAKLNQMESEMQQQARTLNARLESLEYQNEKLASFEVREHTATARLETAAERTPVYASRPAPTPQTLTVPLELVTEICQKGSISASGKLSLEPSLDLDAMGNVGLDEFGDGVKADAKGKFDTKVGFDAGGDTALERNTCLKIVKFNVFGDAPPTVDVGQLINGITTNSEVVADKMAQVFMNLAPLQNAAIVTGLDDLNTLNLGFTAQQGLQILDNPKTAFQNVSGLISSIPMPGNLGNFFQDPSSLFPQPSDINPLNFCSNFTSGTGLISNICSQVPSTLSNLSGITQAIGNITNVQTDLANFKTGLTSVCGNFSNTISRINNTSVTVPQLASFSVPDGLSWNGLSNPPVSLSFHNVSIGPQTIYPIFQLPPVSCPAL